MEKLYFLSKEDDMLEYGLSESEYDAVVDYYSLHEGDDSMFEDFGDFNDEQLKFLAYLLANSESFYKSERYDTPLTTDEFVDEISDNLCDYVDVYGLISEVVDDTRPMTETEMYECLVKCKED